MRVFLTGGSGLLGSHVAERLVADGHEVVALVRPSAPLDFLRGLGCLLVEGELPSTADTLAEAMVGCSHLVHAAALVYSRLGQEAVELTNVTGTRRVLTAAVSAGVAHAVHVSSVAVYGRVEGPVHEGLALDGPLASDDSYGRSKRAAEGVARKVAAEGGLPLTILRPAGIYGERDRLLVPRVARMVRRIVAFTLGNGRNTIPTVYAGNVADAVVRSLLAGRHGVTYDVGLDRPLTQRMLLEGIAQGMGVRPTIVPLPERLVRGGARAPGPDRSVVTG
jgi:nucleoside-diphosphate-sugar epimerase